MHPYVASGNDPWTQLVHAHYWYVNDADFRHTSYWQSEVTECEQRFMQSLPDRTPEETRKALLRNAVTKAYQLADRGRRVPVRIGFQND